MINNQEKIKRTRGGVGFLIHKNIVGSCCPKTLKKIKRRGKKEIKDVRKMLIKVKEENGDTIKILGIYLPSESINKNNRYCRKHVVPLIRKWENKKQKIIIMGDMNTIISKEDHWTTKTLKRKKKANHEMLNTLLNREEES